MMQRSTELQTQSQCDRLIASADYPVLGALSLEVHVPHQHLPSRHSWEKHSPERGATAVESAIVLALLLLVFIAIIEFSVLMTSRANMKAAVNAAVRAGSVASNAADSDYLILQEINAKLSGNVESVEYVIVFNANSAVDSQPPPECVTAAKAGASGLAVQKCNIYNKAVLGTPNLGSFGYDAITNPTATSDKFWPAKSRSATYSGGRDFLGVHIASASKSITGFVPKVQMQTSSILRIEAQDV
jgi:Flp pilus assembly pilin Flp